MEEDTVRHILRYRGQDNVVAGATVRSRKRVSRTLPSAGRVKAIQDLVDEYQDRVLNDYQSLGMLVRFENGRAQISPALKLKNEESEFYYAPGDRRIHKGWVTVKRDHQGLRSDVELFEMMLERGASERQMHKFFEEHPAILMEARPGIPISHRPRFIEPASNEPDFSLSSILGPWRDKAVEVLELKGPGEKTLRTGPHPGFSAKVIWAVDQVRDYDRYLRDPANITAVLQGLGYLPDASKLAVLIGRAPKSYAECEVWAQRQDKLDVKIVTYDEILAKQAAQLQDSHHYRVLSGTPGYPLN